MLILSDLGILWHCKMADTDSVEIHISYDDVHFGQTDAEEMFGELVTVIEKLVREENWAK